MTWLNIVVPVVAFAWALSSGMALAQDRYPTRPIRLVIPFAPGGGSDVTARLLGPRIADRLGQPVVIDNRPAASGVVGADIVAKAVPDGYTLLGTTVTFVINGTLQKGLPYDAFKDFAPITQAIVSPFGLLLHPSVPAKTVKEFIAYARANPGKLLYGSSGPGSSPHLSAELFLSMAGLKMTHVPYKGIAQMMTDILGNQIPLGAPAAASALPQLRAGKLKVLAVTSAKRSSQLPDVPTVAEAGIAGFDVSAWNGLVAPARTPDEVVAKVHGDVIRIAQTKEFVEALQKAGLDTDPLGPAEFRAFIAAELDKWAKLVKASGAKLD